MFAIRNVNGSTLWIKAGVAFVSADDSMNLKLDVLPLDGQLHVRESTPRYQQQSNNGQQVQHNNQRREEPASAPEPVAPQSMGGH